MTVRNQNRAQSETALAAPTGEKTHSKQSETARKTIALLQQGKVVDALNFISPHAHEDSWLTNLKGVCQMRAGKADAAVQTYRSLVLSGGGILLRQEAPAIFKTNFATALLLQGNVAGARATLLEIDRDHPAAVRLQAAINRWLSELTLWQRVNYLLGGAPAHPLHLDFAPGDWE